jgi:hypothetical protein
MADVRGRRNAAGLSWPQVCDTFQIEMHLSAVKREAKIDIFPSLEMSGDRSITQEEAMPPVSTLWSARGVRNRLAATIFVAVSGALLIAPAAHAQSQDDALKILKSMSDYVSGQKTITLSYDTDIEVITPEIQKLQFASSGQVMLSRPDKLHASRVGGYANVEMFFDGKTVSILGKNLNAFTQVDAPGTVDQLVDTLRNKFSVALPGADLLLTNSYDALSADVLHAAHIGEGVVAGFECEHLAFRNEDTDWQLWVQTGDTPIPRKFVITSKTVAGAPQYTMVIRDWKTDAPANPDAFAFKAPDGAKKLDPAALASLDELPPGLPIGGKK